MDVYPPVNVLALYMRTKYFCREDRRAVHCGVRLRMSRIPTRVVDNDDDWAPPTLDLSVGVDTGVSASKRTHLQTLLSSRVLR